MNDSGFEHIDAATAIAAARAQAITEEPDEDYDGDEPPRTTVHSVAIGGRFLLGADWDLDGVVRELERAQEIVWFDDFMGHDLGVKTADGQFYKFAVKRPAAVSR